MQSLLTMPYESDAQCPVRMDQSDETSHQLQITSAGRCAVLSAVRDDAVRGTQMGNLATQRWAGAPRQPWEPVPAEVTKQWLEQCP